jgi:hypothetical protein
LAAVANDASGDDGFESAREFPGRCYAPFRRPALANEQGEHQEQQPDHNRGNAKPKEFSHV